MIGKVQAFNANPSFGNLESCAAEDGKMLMAFVKKLLPSEVKMTKNTNMDEFIGCRGYSY